MGQTTTKITHSHEGSWPPRNTSSSLSPPYPIQPPKRYLDRFSRFAGTSVWLTHRQTDHATCDINRSHLMHGVHATWPNNSKYVGRPYCRAEMYAGRVAYYPWWVTMSMPTGQTEGRTPDRCITLSAGRVSVINLIDYNCHFPNVVSIMHCGGPGTNLLAYISALL